MRNWISTVTFCALVTICLFPTEVRAEKKRKIRIHFFGVSYWSGDDSNENHKFFSGASKASYDAVWDATTSADQFPTGFPKVVVQRASGKVQQRSRGGTDDCDAELTYSTEPGLQPGASIYFRDNKTVAIQIPAPHAAKMIRKDGVALCSGPAFPVYTQGDGVTTTPGVYYENLPPEPGSTTLVDRAGTAALEIDIRRPESSVYFSYSQTAMFSGESYKGVWFGVVTVEENPPSQLPGAPDLEKMTGYIPPREYEAPPEPPPGPIIQLPGGFSRWIRDPIIKDLAGALNALQTIWNSLTGSRSPRARTAQGQPDFTYDKTTRTLTITSTGTPPGPGSLDLAMAIGKGKPVYAGTLSFSSSATHTYSLVLPSAVDKALAKGKAFELKLSAIVTPILNRPGKPVTNKVRIKARSARR